MISPVKVVRLANYVAPASGGLRTALRELGAGYLAAGHEPVLVIPGPRPGRQLTEQGLVITVPGPAVPGTGGYRAITARRSLRRLLEQLEPDRLETSDRTTLRWTGDWARARGIRSMMISHDSLAGLMRMFAPRADPRCGTRSAAPGAVRGPHGGHGAGGHERHAARQVRPHRDCHRPGGDHPQAAARWGAGVHREPARSRAAAAHPGLAAPPAGPPGPGHQHGARPAGAALRRAARGPGRQPGHLRQAHVGGGPAAPQ
jgi:Glycosyltransferase Family 4